MTDLMIAASAITIETATGEKLSNGAPQDPTSKTYSALNVAFAHFNETLFNGRLSACLITLSNHGRSYGYFSDKRFGDRDGTVVTDEIALNPKYFTTRDLERTVSMLVREMAHLAQFPFGASSRNGYHNKQWADWMERVGLMPSDTGEPGGKRTGSHVSHTVIEGGPFSVSCAELLAKEAASAYLSVGAMPPRGDAAAIRELDKLAEHLTAAIDRLHDLSEEAFQALHDEPDGQEADLDFGDEVVALALFPETGAAGKGAA